jgi:hypothetical protein
MSTDRATKILPITTAAGLIVISTVIAAAQTWQRDWERERRDQQGREWMLNGQWPREMQEEEHRSNERSEYLRKEEERERQWRELTSTPATKGR